MPLMNYLPLTVLAASLGAVQAKLDLTSSSNIAVYWGQNSLQGNGGDVQQPLAYYCDNANIDVIPMAFEMMVNGPGGAPEVDFSVTSNECTVFDGTQLKNCPKIGADITTCQEKGKTIILSIGGATYSEGGFKSEADAKAGAKLIWETFGPVQAGSTALRPFGNATLDGFDFDFEATVTYMAPFANELRALMDADTSRQYFLTAAPQCPYPDAADKDILNGGVPIDAVWVQFYNNYCGLNNFNTDSSSSKYNFEEWDNWAKTVSKNPNVKVLIGAPADTTAASTGYVPASKLDEVIQYTKKFESFGGVMMWDTTQAYANAGFLDSVRKSLGDGSSGSSSSNAASTAVSSTKTNSPNTSLSSNAPVLPSSSSSSSGSGSSSSGHEDPETKPATAAPTAPTTKPITTTTSETKPTTAATAAPTAPAATAATAPAPPPAQPTDDVTDLGDDSTDNAKPTDSAPAPQSTDASNSGGIGTDLFALLHNLEKADGVVDKVTDGVSHGLSNNLRRAKRTRR